MSYLPFEYIKYFIFISVIIYFIYDFIDQKKVKDEREEFLKLKTFELVQKVTIFTISLLSIAYILYPDMPAYVPLTFIVISSLYAEIIGKAYLRRKH
jgi:uncharacterized membrane protein